MSLIQELKARGLIKSNVAEANQQEAFKTKEQEATTSANVGVAGPMPFIVGDDEKKKKENEQEVPEVAKNEDQIKEACEKLKEAHQKLGEAIEAISGQKLEIYCPNCKPHDQSDIRNQYPGMPTVNPQVT